MSVWGFSFTPADVSKFFFDRSVAGGVYNSYRFYKDHVEGRTLEDNEFSEWLYGDYDEEKLRKFELLHNIPLVGNYMDYLLDLRADQEYLDRYGMDWTDVHDPRKLRSVNSGSRLYGYAMNFVSDNIKKLYG